MGRCSSSFEETHLSVFENQRQQCASKVSKEAFYNCVRKKILDYFSAGNISR